MIQWAALGFLYVSHLLLFSIQAIFYLDTSNFRYLALESMCLLATSEFSHEAVKRHQETIINSLKTERDVSVRQRAVDLLYAMCDR